MKQENLKINVVFNILSQVILYITPLVIAPYISRTLGPTGVGEYSFAYSIIYYFNIFIIFGFNSYGTKQIASVRDNSDERNKSFWGIICARFLIFIPVSILYVLLVITGVFNEVSSTAVLLALIPVLISSAMDVSFLLQGVEKFRVISLIQVVINITYMAMILLFVKSYNDLIFYTIFKSCIGVCTAFLQIFFVAKYVSKPIIKKDSVVISLKESSLFFLPTVIMTINPILDQTMLGALASVEEIAYYEQIYKIISLVNMLVGAIAPVMLSRISYLYASGDFNECRKKIGQAMHLAYFLIIPAMVGLICIARHFVPAYFGLEFTPAINVMYILAISVMFSPISSIIISSYYYPTHRVKLVTMLMAVSIALNTIANIFAIKYLGAVGAALTTTTLAVLAHILYVLFSWKNIDYISVYKSTWKIVISSILMAVGITVVDCFLMPLITPNEIIITIIEIVVGAGLYGIALLVLREGLVYEVLMTLKRKILKSGGVS